MARTILIVFFLILVLSEAKEHERNFLTALEKKLENKFSEYSTNLVEWLEDINDRHLSNSVLGKMLNYNKIKPKLEEIGNDGRGMKKLSMALLPIIFHVGAISTWLLLTGLLAAKSVAIGIILLVFKIAVSSAKVASFFTAWKHKHHQHDHGWTPHFEHHGHFRSLTGTGIHSDIPYHSYSPDLSDDVPPQEFKTLPTSYLPTSYPAIEYEKEPDITDII